MDNNTIFKGWFYEIEETAHGPKYKVLGVGGYGSVFEIHKKGKNSPKAALKIINIPNDDNEIRQYIDEGYDNNQIEQIVNERKERAEEEIRLMIQLKNKSNIVCIEDYAVRRKDEGIGWVLYIRMELLRSLNEQLISIRKMETEPFSQSRVVNLGIEICNALMKCHKAGILHRDIKPDNIFIDAYGHYKLGDFGISRVLDETTGIVSTTKTDWYAAPEVLRFERSRETADIYSLGLVMYELLNYGRLPFLPPAPAGIGPNDREKSLVWRIRGDRIEPIKGVTNEMNELLLKACAFDPKDRFGSAKEMKECLEEIGAIRIDSVKQCEMGDKYYFGWGVNRNETEAAKWYQRSAEQGYSIAQYNLGLMYENGLGVEQSKAEAVKWYESAAKQGHADAQYSLGLLYEDDPNAGTSKSKAREWYQKAAKQGHADAQFKLGLICEKLGFHSDTIKWYQRAAVQGHADAQQRLDDLRKPKRKKNQSQDKFGIDSDAGKHSEKLKLEKVESVPKTVEDLLDELDEEKNEEENVKIYNKGPSKGVKEVSPLTEKLQMIQSKLEMLQKDKGTEVKYRHRNPVRIEEKESDE